MVEALGQYRILDRIGAGGLGEVYRARDTRLGRTVALKVVSADIAADRDRRDRLLHDAHAAAALSHPNIAALYEAGEDQNQLYLAFEFVPGASLAHVIGGRPLHPRRAVDFAAQIADALADAHAHGIVHRDLTCDNIIVTPKEKAKILDFGLAAWTAGGAARQRAVAATAVAAGTPAKTLAYMSPEQARGEPVDHRTDIFSLGVVLFEMLTGRPPFAGPSAAELTRQIAQLPVNAASTTVRTPLSELNAVVAKALASSPDERYESAATLTAELLAIAAVLDTRVQLSEASSSRAPSAIAKSRRRSRLGWMVLAIVAVALVAAWYALR